VSGVFLFASDGTTDGETGGEATHTLTVDEMPSHGHYQKIDQSGYTHIACSDNGDGPVVSEGKYIYQQYVGTVQNSKMFSTFSTGGGQPHNNMPPYRKVSMWRRTA
jgi:microcystin-dependent protein